METNGKKTIQRQQTKPTTTTSMDNEKIATACDTLASELTRNFDENKKRKMDDDHIARRLFHMVKKLRRDIEEDMGSKSASELEKKDFVSSVNQSLATFGLDCAEWNSVSTGMSHDGKLTIGIHDTRGRGITYDMEGDAGDVFRMGTNIISQAVQHDVQSIINGKNVEDDAPYSEITTDLAYPGDEKRFASDYGDTVREMIEVPYYELLEWAEECEREQEEGSDE